LAWSSVDYDILAAKTIYSVIQLTYA